MEEAQKLRRTNPNEDRISNLPDHLIEEILGFLPVKEAIETCVLSKQWRYSWKSLQTLSFSHSYHPKFDTYCEKHRPRRGPRMMFDTEQFLILPFGFRDLGDNNGRGQVRLTHNFRGLSNTQTSTSEKGFNFVKFIDKALEELRNSNLIKKVHLSLVNSMVRCYEYHVDSWVQFALNHEVEELSLEFDKRAMYELRTSSTIYHLRNSSIKKLGLKNCLLELDQTYISWASLRVLRLNEVKGLAKNMEAILCGSPVLECLNLYKLECAGACIRIASTSLKELVLDGLIVGKCSVERGPFVIEISCPNLSSLCLMGRVDYSPYRRDSLPFSSLKLAFVDISSLVEATIDFHLGEHVFGAQSLRDFNCFFVDDLLRKLNHVAKITIGAFGLELLSMLELCDDLCTPLPISSHISLVLNANINKGYFREIVKLLEISPDLQKLTLQRKPFNFKKVRFCGATLGNNEKNLSLEKKAKRSFKCFDGNLKSIEIVGFDTCDSCLKLIGKLLKFIRKNATIPKINISTQGDFTSPTMSVQEVENLLRLYEESTLKSDFISLCIHLSSKKKRKRTEMNGVRSSSNRLKVEALRSSLSLN